MSDIDHAFDIRDMPREPNPDKTWRDTIVRACICGNRTFNIVATFDDEGEIAGYFTEATCYDCGRWVRVPVPGE